MAIIEAVPGIRVTVESGGKTLDEYPDENEVKYKDYRAPKERTSASYIECTSDTEFQMRFEVMPGYVLVRPGTHIYFLAAVDGQDISGAAIPISKCPYSVLFSRAVSEVNDREKATHTLKFCSIKKSRFLSRGMYLLRLCRYVAHLYQH